MLFRTRRHDEARQATAAAARQQHPPPSLSLHVLSFVVACAGAHHAHNVCLPVPMRARRGEKQGDTRQGRTITARDGRPPGVNAAVVFQGPSPGRSLFLPRAMLNMSCCVWTGAHAVRGKEEGARDAEEGRGRSAVSLPFSAAHPIPDHHHGALCETRTGQPPSGIRIEGGRPRALASLCVSSRLG